MKYLNLRMTNNVRLVGCKIVTPDGVNKISRINAGITIDSP